MGRVRSGLSARLSIPIWPVPSSTVGGTAELSGAIPAQLCLPSSRPRAAPALLPSPGHLSPGSSTGRCPWPPALLLPARPTATAASERRPPGPDSPSQSSRPNRPAAAAALSPCLPPCRDSVPARSQRSQPRCLTTPLKPPRQGAGQHWGGILKPGHGGGKAGQEPRRCVAPAWCSRNLSIRIGKRKVPSNHPGNRSKTQHDWPNRLGNSRKETAWPLCHGLEPLLWGEAPGRAQGCSPATCLHEASLAAGTE